MSKAGSIFAIAGGTISVDLPSNREQQHVEASRAVERRRAAFLLRKIHIDSSNSLSVSVGSIIKCVEGALNAVHTHDSAHAHPAASGDETASSIT